jgi:hypothetical protein
MRSKHRHGLVASVFGVLLLLGLAFAWLVLFGIRGGPAP